MRSLLLVTLAVMTLLLGAMSCGPASTPPTPTPTPAPAPTPAPTPEPTPPEPTPPEPTPPEPTPPPPAIQVALDYFGVKDTHQPPISVSENLIQLFIVVDDGETSKQFLYPRSGDGLPMDYFQLVDLDEQTIFQTSSVGDQLTISALAYSCTDKQAILDLGRALESFQPGIGSVLDFYEKLPQSKELIGWYEHTWYETEEWGANQEEYEAKGENDLKLWFRIWSDKEPAEIPKPLFVPAVKIQDVELPTDAKPGYTKYPISLWLVNDEMFNVPILWEAVSSQTRKFDSGKATVPKNGKPLEIRRSYYWEVGDRTITYTVYYYFNNAKLDTWSGALNITP